MTHAQALGRQCILDQARHLFFARGYDGVSVRDIVHGRAVKNQEALANPEALDLYRDLPALRT